MPPEEEEDNDDSWEVEADSVEEAWMPPSNSTPSSIRSAIVHIATALAAIAGNRDAPEVVFRRVIGSHSSRYRERVELLLHMGGRGGCTPPP